MSKRTNRYGMVYFEQGDLTSAQYEMQRWETIDAQLAALFSIMGNGVISGWNILAIENGGLSCAVAPGSGHVGFVAVASDSNVTLSLTPSSLNYIYAQLNDDSYWTKSVSFISVLDPMAVDTDKNLYLGSVTTGTDGIPDGGIDTSGRTELGFLALVQAAIKNHRHNGSEDNPDPINLATDVQGILGRENFPDLDASLIQTGTIDTDRLPLIDHISGLTNQGILTHAQLDSYIETLSLENQSLMGEVSTTNLLQLILALKHVYPDIDEFLVNEIAFIPGISPNDYIDTVNTTADVDTRTYAEGGQHTISGVSTESFKAYTKLWDTNDDYDEGTLSNTVVQGSYVTLDTEVSELSVDQFSDINQWEVSTHDLSSISAQLTLDGTTYVSAPTSAKLLIGSESIEVQLLVKKTFDAQDWSEYDYLTFYLYTQNVNHGDLFFYISDAVYGEQNSSVKVLNRNAPTINDDTLLNGWQEVTIDIRDLNRENIDTMGFYVSTQDGWDTSIGFDLNIDAINLTAGNVYLSDGYIRVNYGDSLLKNFWRLRWDATIPTDSLSSGVNLQARTRVANSEIDLESAAWSSYFSVSGTEIELPSSSLYKYIQIEMYFTASSSLKRSATLHSISLDYYAVDIEGSFEFTTQEDWQNGSLFNIDTLTSPGSILIDGANDYGNYIYGTEGNVKQLNSNLQELYGITGSLFPRSTDQVINGESPSIGLVTAIARGNSGNIWFTDIDNNRVFEVTKGGDLVRGFQGSYISTPLDYYGVEDSGPGSNDISNVNVSIPESTSATDFQVLHTLYNPEYGELYVVFNKDLENIYSSSSVFDQTKFYIKAGGHKVWLNGNVELVGVDQTHYDLWNSLYDSDTEAAKYIKQFKFTSHILKFTISGSDKTLLDYMVDQEQPSIIIYTPQKQERLNSGNVTVRFSIYNFDLANGGNGVKVTLDGTSSQVIYTDRVSYAGLSSGEHTVRAQLQNADGSLNTNIEAIAETTFVVYSGSYTQPYVYFTSPKANQIYSSSPVTVEFKTENFPIIQSGQHLKYQIDSEAAEDYYSTDPIVLENLSVGKHTVTIWLVDVNGADLSYTYGSAEVDFIVGLNSNVITKLYVKENAIADADGNALSAMTNLYVDVENIRFINIYSPIDIQMIPAESSVNNDGLPTVLIAKLRSQSSIDQMAGVENVTEVAQRIAVEAGGANVLSEAFTGIPTENLIYDSFYLDGHSVVQLNMEGEVIFSNNAAVFETSKEGAKDSLGSAEKIGDSELLIGDSVNQRAMIIYTDLTTKYPQIMWQYNSDRKVVDFHLNIQDEREINVYDGSISDATLYVRQGMNVIWTNESSVPVSIYSGETTYESFTANPNLNLYGEEFHSGVLEPGDTYTFKFEEEGVYPWFVYPPIITGEIQVTKQRISPQDQYFILESDGLESPFSSRLIKIDSWGNVVWSFGESYLVKPRDVRPLLNNRVLIST
ncbi:MAG: hypothetical protein WC119_01750 [Synergistaceae bacterium]